MNTLITPLPLNAAPASAQGAGQGLRARLARVRASIWQVLEEIGRARARRELMALAAYHEATQPELAKELRAACGYSS